MIWIGRITFGKSCRISALFKLITLLNMAVSFQKNKLKTHSRGWENLFEVMSRFSCSHPAHGWEGRFRSGFIQISCLIKTNRSSLATTYNLCPDPTEHLLYKSFFNTKKQNISVNLATVESDFSKSGSSIFWIIRFALPVCWCFLEKLSFTQCHHLSSYDKLNPNRDRGSS